ncbi:MAG: type II toxin-antitoxin system VapC family toxin [Acidobacteriaceae bacterium]|jgi:predicted nucleic acid-binding protein
MILVDTSVWVDHLRKSDPAMENLLDQDQVLSHPLVVGELAMGDLRPRDAILRFLRRLPSVVVASHDEVLRFILQHKLFGLGIGYIDAHLLGAVQLTPDTTLWTRDKRLAQVAEQLKIAFHPFQ